MIIIIQTHKILQNMTKSANRCSSYQKVNFLLLKNSKNLIPILPPFKLKI